MTWMTEPLTQYAALASGLMLSLYLFVSVKRENQQLRRRLESERQAYQSMLGALRTTLNRLEEEMAGQRDALPASEALRLIPTASLNLTKRSQAIRMHRHGDSTEVIASSLQVPRNEIELLLKVHSAVLQQA